MKPWILPPLLAFMAWYGCSKAPGNPFDPTHSLYPEYPLTEVLTVDADVTKTSFTFGEQPQFKLTFTNSSGKTVDLSAREGSAIYFRPYASLHILREDGRDMGYSRDLKGDSISGILEPHQSAETDFPDQGLIDLLRKSYSADPRALLPGKYQYYFQFWVERKGKPERLLSPVKPLVIKEDEAGKWKIASAGQKAAGVEEHLVLEIGKSRFNQVGLTATNTGPNPLYLGSDWRWRKKGPWSLVWNEYGGGLRPVGYVTVLPGETVSLGEIGFNPSDARGIYEMEVRYYDRSGVLRKASNRIKMKVE